MTFAVAFIAVVGVFVMVILAGISMRLAKISLAIGTIATIYLAWMETQDPDKAAEITLAVIAQGDGS